MLSTLRDLFSPKRRQARRDVEGMFGSYISPELVEKMIEEGTQPHAMRSPREKVRLIAFFYPDWGFSDAALPKLSAMLEGIDTPADVSHSSVTVCFTGEEKKAEYDRVRALFEAAATQAEFSGVKVGVAEGFSECFTDIGRIAAEAFRNGRNA